MRALVVYETVFGCEADAARAVAEGLGHDPETTVTVAEVHGVRPQYAEMFDVVVVTGPNRASARGTRDWLARLPDGLERSVLTYETRSARRLLVSERRRAVGWGVGLAVRVGLGVAVRSADRLAR